MLKPCFYPCVSASVWALMWRGWPVSLPLYLTSPHLYRCPRTTGAVSLLWGRMTRSRAGGCAAAATSRPWRKRTAATRTAAPNLHPRSRRDGPATWRPHSRPSLRWPHSSKCVFVLKHWFSLSGILWKRFWFRKWKITIPQRYDDVLKSLVFFPNQKVTFTNI